MRQPPLFLFLVLLLVLSGRALAQTARWEPAGGQLSFNQVSEITLIFEDCEPDGGVPELPAIDGLFLGRPSISQQSSFSMGFGSGSKRTSTYSLTYPVRPTKRAPIRIPALTVETDKGKVTVPAASYTVGETTGGAAGRSGPGLDDIANAKLTTPKNSVWVGEVFPLTYTLTVTRRYFHSLASVVDWPAAPFLAEDWTKPELNETLLQGERRVVSVQTTRALAKEPGNFQLKPASQAVNVVVGTSGFSVFQQAVVEPRQMISDPIDLIVKPLPAPPTGFTGAVGQLELKSKVVPARAGVNEPITWTLELSGVGNWPDIPGLPAREVSNDFQVVQPTARRTMKDGALFEGTLSEDVVLVPTQAGTYTLGPVKFTYFDTKSGAYRTLTTEPVTVTVNAAATPATAATPSFNVPQVAPPVTGPTIPTAVPPATPENLPTEPVLAPGHGRAPWTATKLWQAASIPAAALVLLAWVILAAARSRAQDPQRLRREAARRLSSVLAELGASGTRSAALATHLHAWQRETMLLWQIAHAAPGAPLVHAVVGGNSRDAAADWSKLWQEADRFLHGPAAELPGNWVQRAQAALQAVRIPGWNPLSLLAPRNLLPFVFTAFVVLTLSFPSSARADAAAESYKAGNFPAAEAAWRAAVDAEPASWSARHNLGLALGQQDRWAEAAAHWTSAFLLAPRAPETAWDLALGLQRSGLAPAELVELSRAEGRHALAIKASPSEWQLGLVGASLALAAAVILLLLQGYRRIGNWAKPTAMVVSLAAILLAGAATLSLDTYGKLAHPDVALVWRQSVLRSIPTDADTSQKTSPLSPGSLAVVDRTFLGWSRLVFDGGQNGWVRTEDLVMLYR